MRPDRGLEVNQYFGWRIELDELKKNAQHERDDILSRVREILGAQSQPQHETAIQAASRVVGERNRAKCDLRNLQDRVRLALRD